MRSVMSRMRSYGSSDDELSRFLVKIPEIQLRVKTDNHFPNLTPLSLESAKQIGVELGGEGYLAIVELFS